MVTSISISRCVSNVLLSSSVDILVLILSKSFFAGQIENWFLFDPLFGILVVILLNWKSRVSTLQGSQSQKLISKGSQPQTFVSKVSQSQTLISKGSHSQMLISKGSQFQTFISQGSQSQTFISNGSQSHIYLAKVAIPRYI